MKKIRYLLVKDHTLAVKETEDFASLLKEELGDYDSRDWLFTEALDIRIFVKDLSIYDQKGTLYYYRGGELLEIFCGTVIFAKSGKQDFRSLSKKDLSLLKKKLIKKAYCDDYEIHV